MRTKLFTLFAAMIVGGSAFASGFQVLLQGTRQTAMGNVGVGLRPDAASLFFNPGAMGMMDHNSISLGVNPIFAENVYYDSETINSTYVARTDNPIGTPFYLYGVFGPANSDFKFGIGVYTPYGSSVDWEEGWKGKYLLDEIQLAAIYIQPTVSYKISDQLSIGVGFVYMTGNVNLQRALPINSQSGVSSVTLDGSASGMGFNAGIFYQLSEKFSIGFNYRSKVVAKVDGGDAIFVVPKAAEGLFEGNKFDATLPLPSNTTLGLAYYPSNRLTLSVEGSLVGWSAYEELRFDWNAPVNGQSASVSPRNYENSITLRAGGEYLATDKLALRAGIYYDETPVQDGYMTPETPDSDRLGLTAGIGYTLFEKLQVDLTFLFIEGWQREMTRQEAINAGTLDPQTGSQDVIPGTYKLRAFIPGIGLSYNF